MQRGAGYVIAGSQELDWTGNWSLVRRSLDRQAFGVNLVDIPPASRSPSMMRPNATKRNRSS